MAPRSPGAVERTPKSCHRAYLSGFCGGSSVSSRRPKQQVRIRSRVDEDPMSIDCLRVAEQLFAKLAVRMLLRDATGNGIGRAVAPPSRREGAHPSGERPGPSESERGDDHTKRGTGARSPG